MEQVEVEITGQAITARYGTLSAGDILRTDQAFADHLVNDCGVAKHVVTKAKKPAAQPAPAAPKAKAKASPKSVAAGADVCTDPPAGGAADAPG